MVALLHALRISHWLIDTIWQQTAILAIDGTPVPLTLCFLKGVPKAKAKMAMVPVLGKHATHRRTPWHEWRAKRCDTANAAISVDKGKAFKMEQEDHSNCRAH